MFVWFLLGVFHVDTALVVAGRLHLLLSLQRQLSLCPLSCTYKQNKRSSGHFLFLNFLPLPHPSFFPLFLPFYLPSLPELAALNGGHWAVRLHPPQPLATLAPLSLWLKKNTTCTALVVFYLSSSPLHVEPTSRSWRSWMRTLAGDLPIAKLVFCFKKELRWTSFWSEMPNVFSHIKIYSVFFFSLSLEKCIVFLKCLAFVLIWSVCMMCSG